MPVKGPVAPELWMRVPVQVMAGLDWVPSWSIRRCPERPVDLADMKDTDNVRLELAEDEEAPDYASSCDIASSAGALDLEEPRTADDAMLWSPNALDMEHIPEVYVTVMRDGEESSPGIDVADSDDIIEAPRASTGSLSLTMKAGAVKPEVALVSDEQASLGELPIKMTL